MTALISLTYQENDEEKAYKMSMQNCMKSDILKTIVEDINDDTSEIPLMEKYFTTNSLTLLDEYLTYHVQNPTITSKPKKPLNNDTLSENGVCDFDVQFISKLSMDEIHNLVLIGNFLDIPELLDLMCAVIAFKAKHTKNVDEMIQLLRLE